MDPRITLDKDARDRAAKALKEYLDEHHDVEIGDLGSHLLLDHLLATVGPAVYNRAIRDAQAFLSDKLIDMEASLYVPEAPPEE